MGRVGLSLFNVGFRGVAPAVAPIREILGDEANETPPAAARPWLLVHPFSGSGSGWSASRAARTHVAHMTMDPDRHWEIVRSAWDGSSWI